MVLKQLQVNNKKYDDLKNVLIQIYHLFTSPLIFVSNIYNSICNNYSN